MKNGERVLIYAAGAVGLGIASCLIKAGIDVDIIARKETVAALNSHGLYRTGIFGEFRAAPGSFGAFQSIERLSFRYRFVLVCCKSFDTLNAARDLYNHSHVIDDKGLIVLFQNGWGNAEVFLQFFEKDMIYNARVITGFERKGPNVVNITVHADAIHIGSLFRKDLSRIQRLCEHISEGGIPCSPTTTIEKDLWAKMLYNCLLNPLSAVLMVPYGKLAESGYTRNIMDNIARELFMVMERAAYETHWKKAEEYLEQFYNKLIPATAAHRSSMLQDIINGKRTEIDSLNGAVIRLAEKEGLCVPYNRIVYEMVKFLEDKGKTL